MRTQLSQLKRLLATVQGVAPDMRRTAIRDLSKRRIKRVAHQLRRRTITAPVRVADIAGGTSLGTWLFWTVTYGRSWHDVEARLNRLFHNDRDALEEFVITGLEQTSDPIIVAGLAQHPLSHQFTRAWLANRANRSRIGDRVRTHRLLGAAFSGAGILLLPPDESAELTSWIEAVYEVPHRDFYSFQASMSWKRVGPADRPIKRLIITDKYGSAADLSQLFLGADTVTVISTLDTYGRLDFSHLPEGMGPRSVTVEHIRSRITRFSDPYIKLHEAITGLVPSVIQGAMDVIDPIPADFQPTAEVAVADSIFFQSLRVLALQELVDDDDFDEIIVAVDNHRATSEYLRLLSSIDALKSDDRVDIRSISRSADGRLRFLRQVDEILGSQWTAPSPSHTPPADIIAAKYDEAIQRIAQNTAEMVAQGPSPWIGFATANVPAYNLASAGYIADLTKDFAVGLIHLSSNATTLIRELSNMGVASDINPVFVQSKTGADAPFADALHRHLHKICPPVNDDLDPYLATAIKGYGIALSRIIRSDLVPSITRYRVLDALFAILAATDRLPDAIVISPNRNPAVSAITSIARHVGVPTICVEPHAQDNNYARYAKVTADYYGVMSDYFRHRASAGFGIPLDRTFTLGSPRLIAPANYDAEQEQKLAQAELATSRGITLDPDRVSLVFFSQALNWDHLSSVWATILTAAQRTDSMVFLKPHPEDTPSRTQHYLDQAATSSIEVVVLDGNAKQAIALADITLTAFSTVGVEAAARQTPVVCVTDGDLPYPLDIASIVGGDTVGSADELVRIITAYRDDPEAAIAKTRAFVDREPQFIEGPRTRLRALVNLAIDQGADGMRQPEELPSSIFLDGPHPRFEI